MNESSETRTEVRTESRFQLGNWTVEPDTLRIERSGEVTTLQPKTMAVLVQFAKHQGQLVSKTELLDTVWAGQFVVEGVLKRAVSDLRRALGDDPKKPQFVETIPRKGYRLIEPAVFLDLPEPARIPSAPTWTDGSPYRGLSPFEFHHAPIFFGRDRATREMVRSITSQAIDGRAFLLVLGMSGGGKSSAVQAGLLPSLTKPGVVDGVTAWTRATFRPSDSPSNLIAGLAGAVTAPDALPTLLGDDFAQLLASSHEAGIAQIEEALKQIDPSGRARLVLVIDQMEEMFTLAAISESERAEFFDLMHALARSGLCWVIATLRSDFYPRAAAEPTIRGLKRGAGQYDLPTPTRAEIGAMIRRPAEAVGLTFEQDPETGERLDDVLADTAFGTPGALPLLEFTLAELEKKRTDDGTVTFAAYRQLGGVGGGLVVRAETLFLGLPAPVQSSLPNLLEELVSIDRNDDTSVAARPSPWSRVTSTPEAQQLVEAFVDARLFVAELNREGERVVRVAHESLFRLWPRVRGWLELNRQKLKLHERLARAAQRWDQDQRNPDFLLPGGKPLLEMERLVRQGIRLTPTESEFLTASTARARRSVLFAKLMRASVALLAVAAVVTALWANQQRRRANRLLSRAEVESRAAEQTTAFLIDIFEVSDPSESQGESLSAREILDNAAKKIENFEGDPFVQTKLMNAIGKVYQQLGLLDAAAPQLERALEVRRQTLDGDQVEIAESLSALATLRNTQGDTAQGRLLARESLDMLTRIHGRGHVDVLEAYNIVGASSYAEADFEKATEAFGTAVEIGRDLGDDESTLSEYAVALNNLAAAYHRLGESAEAATYYEEALGIVRRSAGPMDPDIAVLNVNLANVLRDQNESERAVELTREAVEINRQVLDPSHPRIALSMSALGIHLLEQEKLDEAEPWLRDAIEAMDATGEAHPTHPGHSVFHGNYALLLLARGNTAEAIEVAQRAVQEAEDRMPEGHWVTASQKSILGATLTAAGDYRAAERILLDSNSSLHQQLGESTRYARTSRARLNELYRAWDRPEQAARYAEPSEEEAAKE